MLQLLAGISEHEEHQDSNLKPLASSCHATPTASPSRGGGVKSLQATPEKGRGVEGKRRKGARRSLSLPTGNVCLSVSISVFVYLSIYLSVCLLSSLE